MLPHADPAFCSVPLPRFLLLICEYVISGQRRRLVMMTLDEFSHRTGYGVLNSKGMVPGSRTSYPKANPPRLLLLSLAFPG